MVRIRLKRTGTRNLSCFRVVVVDQRSTRDGRTIEEIGFYDPRHNEERMTMDRYDHWIGMGAQPSKTVKDIVRRINNPKTEAERKPETTQNSEEEKAAEVKEETQELKKEVTAEEAKPEKEIKKDVSADKKPSEAKEDEKPVAKENKAEAETEKPVAEEN